MCPCHDCCMQAMQVQNHVWGPAIMTLLTAVANVPINIWLIKYYDFWGAAVATSVARILLLILLIGTQACSYRLCQACINKVPTRYNTRFVGGLLTILYCTEVGVLQVFRLIVPDACWLAAAWQYRTVCNLHSSTTPNPIHSNLLSCVSKGRLVGDTMWGSECRLFGMVDCLCQVNEASNNTDREGSGDYVCIEHSSSCCRQNWHT